MQLTHILPLFALTGYAAAGCYQDGIEWSDRQQALGIVKSACEQLLIGKYGPKNTFNGERRTCANMGPNKIDIIITHIQGGDRDLPYEECYDGLQKEVTRCSRGGDTSYTNWRYKADPNAGNC
ncbi:hypothetical protein QBC35DRAFT_452261 [Podospora australis]|uniref:Secreted protein n=1 Tax=Podospora australis TaxID=1536484 RepID=A0AAN7AI54_9PEZI|nr:hypothetical protein QBC35DRAFT_452261 [Podospora australis]